VRNLLMSFLVVLGLVGVSAGAQGLKVAPVNSDSDEATEACGEGCEKYLNQSDLVKGEEEIEKIVWPNGQVNPRTRGNSDVEE
jgi:hypothetical protein